jgi:hypothetical protein
MDGSTAGPKIAMGSAIFGVPSAAAVLFIVLSAEA